MTILKQPDIDELDVRLLIQLQRDASLSNHDLALLLNTSPPTCLRRVKRLHKMGFIERQVALLNPEKVRLVTGAGLTAIAEITLERQDATTWDHFERRAAQEANVAQCYRVSPGPDFILVIHVVSMADYLSLCQRLFTQDANVRNVKTFFSIKRSKFGVELPLSAGSTATALK